MFGTSNASVCSSANGTRMRTNMPGSNARSVFGSKPRTASVPVAGSIMGAM